MEYRNIRLNPLLRLIYLWLRITARAGFSIFYRKRLVLNPDNLRFDGPAIVIANHPSTLTDVLHVGISIHQEMFFLANYGLFKHPVSKWIFTRLFCIPIKRKEDVEPGEARDNDAGFQQCFRHLEQTGILFIAPEGVSWTNRFVRPFKTGTARIAFGAESRHAWGLDLKIIPVGLSYSDPTLFRSEVVVNTGAPVYPRDWQAAWQQDPESAIDQFTAHLEKQIQLLTIHTADEQGEQLISRLETIVGHEWPLDQEAAFYRSQQLTHTCLNDQDLASSTQQYVELLEKNKVTDGGVSAASAPDHNAKTISDGLRLALGFPFFLLGYICWFLPCYLPWLLNKKLNIYVGYSSTIKIFAGLVVFPLTFWAVYRIVLDMSGDWTVALAALILLILLGRFTERYLDILNRFQDRQKAAAWAQSDPAGFGLLISLRRDIVRTCQTRLKTTPAANTTM